MAGAGPCVRPSTRQRLAEADDALSVPAIAAMEIATNKQATAASSTQMLTEQTAVAAATCVLHRPTLLLLATQASAVLVLAIEALATATETSRMDARSTRTILRPTVARVATDVVHRQTALQRARLASDRKSVV